MQGVGDRCENNRCQYGRSHYAGQGQRSYGEAISPELFELDVKRRLEEQPGQKHAE